MHCCNLQVKDAFQALGVILSGEAVDQLLAACGNGGQQQRGHGWLHTEQQPSSAATAAAVDIHALASLLR